MRLTRDSVWWTYGGKGIRTNVTSHGLEKIQAIHRFTSGRVLISFLLVNRFVLQSRLEKLQERAKNGMTSDIEQYLLAKEALKQTKSDQKRSLLR